ncbi:MAG: hypothetical protein Kow00127_08060 [Bacteroidales bacterium]
MEKNAVQQQEEKKEMEKEKVSYKSLLIENIKYRTLLTEKFKQRKPFEKKNPKMLTAFIPGTIRQIYVKPKSRVKVGDKLLILEAMKMRNDIVSPINGTIKAIHVKKGNRVAKNDLLIEFA